MIVGIVLRYRVVTPAAAREYGWNIGEAQVSGMGNLKRYLVDDLVEDYRQSRLTRRDALRVIGGLVGASLAARLLAGCAAPTTTGSARGRPTDSAARSVYSVAANDPAVVAGAVSFPGEGATLSGYLARPAAAGRFPVVLVCHANRGLTPHMEDVTRRLAKAGYVALAVDLLAREGGTAKHSPEQIWKVLGDAPEGRHVQDFRSALAYARTQAFSRADRAGMTGFCFGGGVTWLVAVAMPELAAAVPFYGYPADASDAPKINAAVLAIYAAQDSIILASKYVPPIEAAMHAAGKRFRKVIYPGVDHAFHDDTGDSFDAPAAKAAWEETLAWFNRYLKA